MTEEQRNKTQKKIMILSLAVILLLAACLIFLVVTNRTSTVLLASLGGGFLAVYWLISDVLSVVWLKSFEGKTDEQKKAYYEYAALNLIGFAGLVYFIVESDSMYGAVIFAASILFRRRFYDNFKGKTEQEDDNDSAQEPQDGETEPENKPEGELESQPDKENDPKTSGGSNQRNS